MVSCGMIAQMIADSIVTCRDFCGDEQEAAIDAFNDLVRQGSIEQDQKAEAIRQGFELANRQWRGWKRKAGVKSKYIRR